jgi:hypothetical protein
VVVLILEVLTDVGTAFEKPYRKRHQIAEIDGVNGALDLLVARIDPVFVGGIIIPQQTSCKSTRGNDRWRVGAMADRDQSSRLPDACGSLVRDRDPGSRRRFVRLLKARVSPVSTVGAAGQGRTIPLAENCIGVRISHSVMVSRRLPASALAGIQASRRWEASILVAPIAAK